MPRTTTTRRRRQPTTGRVTVNNTPAEISADESASLPQECETCGHNQEDCYCFTCAYCDIQRNGEDYDQCSTCERCGNCCACWYCDDCNEQHRDGDRCPNRVLLEYNARADEFYGFFPKRRTVPASFLYLGVELETEIKLGHNAGDTVAALEEVPEYNKWALSKRDGSLSNGIEVVSAPSSLEEHTKRWPAILPTMLKHTESWVHRSTGMHVHISRAAFTPLSLAKFVYFINASETRPYVVSLAGRTSPDYARIKKKRLGKNEDTHTGDRYEAVNTTNDATIEVRLFKGTLNTDHVLANIEFCHALTLWCRECSLVDAANWAAFFSYVQRHKKTYKHLLGYMDHVAQKVKKHMDKVFENHTETRVFFMEDCDSEVEGVAT